MGDVFKEQIVKKEDTKKDMRKRAAIISGAAFFSIGSYYLLGISSLPLILVIIIIAYFLINRTFIEYEYIYTNGLLDIDCIYNKSKRKHILTVNTDSFDIMAHIDDKEHLAPYENLKIKDFSSGEIYGNTYVFVTYYKGEKVKFIIEPNEEMLEIMNIALTPRRLFKKI